MEEVKKESLEQAKGSVVGMTATHEKFQEIYTQWFDKTNKVIEQHKEQKRHVATSGSGTSHKRVLGAYWSRKVAS